MSSTATRAEVLALTLGIGSLIGANTALAKGVVLSGVTPLSLLLWHQAGSAALLLLALGLRREGLPRDRRVWAYGATLGLFSLTLPSAIGFTVMPRIGAGTYAAMFTLSPLATFGLRWALARRYPGHRRLAGLLLGGLGAWGLVWIGLRLAPGEAGWLALALCTPLLLATGNLVRERFLPAGPSAWQLSIVQPLTQLALLVPLAVATGTPFPHPGAPWDGVDLVLVLQAGIGVASYPLFFRLQARADAIALSQLGYVTVLAGSSLGALLHDEPLSPWMALALALLFAGVRLVGTRPAPAEPAVVRAAWPPTRGLTSVLVLTGVALLLAGLHRAFAHTL